MNKKHILAPLMMVSMLTLGACSQAPIEAYKKVLTPAGAPALAFYDRAFDEGFETNSVPKNVMAQLTQDNYGMIVMDFSGGLNTIKKAKSEYRLARIITGGNLYLININGKETKPTATDKVVVFGGETSLPVLALKALIPEIAQENLINVPSVKEAGAAMKTGKVNDVAVEYVLVAQPIYTKIFKDLTAEKKKLVKVVSNLRNDWAVKTEADGKKQTVIPQAGLFVHETMYKEHKLYFENELNALDRRIDNALTNIDDVVATMNQNQVNLDDQVNRFGFNSQLVKGVQTNPLIPNGFALVSTAEAKALDIHDFLKSVGNQTDYTEYILDRTASKDEAK